MVSWPSNLLPSRNSTLATWPPGSLAVAVTVIVGFHANIAPSAGEVTVALGRGVVRRSLTVIVARRARGRGAEVVGRARGERCRCRP